MIHEFNAAYKASLSLCNLHPWEEWQVLFIRPSMGQSKHIFSVPLPVHVRLLNQSLDNSSDWELEDPFGECTYCQNSCRARGHKPHSTDTCLQKKHFTQRHMFKLLQFKTLGEINTQLQQQQPETIKMAFQGVRAFHWEDFNCPLKSVPNLPNHLNFPQHLQTFHI